MSSELEKCVSDVCIGRYLDDKREQFCRLIVQRLGLADSYLGSIDRHVKSDVAKQLAYELTKVPEVSARILELEEERRVLRNLSRESIVVGLSMLSRVSITDYFDVIGGSGCPWLLKHPDDWTPEMKAACKGLKFTKHGVEITIYSKTEIIPIINSIMGYNAPQQNINVNKSEFDSYTDEELKQYVECEEVDSECEEVEDGEPVED